MGECCAGPPPFCEVLIHTKRGNRAIELGPRPYFPPPKPRASFRPGILAKRPRGLNPQTSQNSIKAKFAEFGLGEVQQEKRAEAVLAVARSLLQHVS
jgi:hypothetical protein